MSSKLNTQLLSAQMPKLQEDTAELTKNFMLLGSSRVKSFRKHVGENGP